MMKQTVRVLVVLAAVVVLTTCEGVFSTGLGDDVDLEPPTISIDSHVDGDYVSGTARFEGAFGDDLGAPSVQISVAAITGSDSPTPVFSDIQEIDDSAGTWAYEIDTTTLSDGEYEVRVRATDSAEKETDAKTVILVDNSPSIVVVSSPEYGSDELVNGTIVIRGEAYDLHGVVSVELTIIATPTDGVPVTVTGTAQGTTTWSYMLDTESVIPTDGASGTIDGTLDISIATQDRAGQISSVLYHATDLYEVFGVSYSAEDVYGIVTGLSADDAGTAYSTAVSSMTLSVDQSLDDVQFEFVQPVLSTGLPVMMPQDSTATGAVTDDDGVQYGVGLIQMKIAETSSFDAAPWQDISASGLSGGTSRANWAWPLAGYAQGVWRMQLRAKSAPEVDETVDDVQWTLSPVNEFVLDFGPPSIDETGSGISGSAVVYRNGDVPLSGLASDGNGIQQVLVIYSKDGGSETTLLDDTVSGDQVFNWSTVLPGSADHSDDGAYQVLLSTTDISATTTSLYRNIVIDTTQPELTISSPIGDEFIDSLYTIRGQVNDGAGRGVQSLQMSLDGSTWSDIVLTGLNWSVTEYDFSSGGEGIRTLWVRASDGLNGYAQESVTFSYDLALPSLMETAIGTEEQVVTNGDAVLAGTVSDTNGLDVLTITTTLNGSDRGEVYSTSSTGAWSYTHNLSGDGSDDGEWVYTITALDDAGRETVLERNVFIDETAPSIPTIAPIVADYLESRLSVSGTAADGGSSVDMVEWSLDGSTWNTAVGTSNWYKNDIDILTGDFSLSEGEYAAYARVIDRAGNVSSVASTAFTVDRYAPVLDISGYDGVVYRSGSFTVDGTIADTLDLADGGGPIGSTSVTVSATRDGSPVDLSSNPISLSGSGTTLLWEQTIPDDGDGEYSVTIVGSDAVGRTDSATISVRIDRVAPTITVLNLSDGDVLNTLDYPVNGTASDAVSGVTLVEYRFDGGAGFGPWQPAGGTTSWTSTLNGLSDGLGQVIEFRSTDGAGNVGVVTDAETIDFDVDSADPTLTEVDSGIGGTSLVYRGAPVTLGGAAIDGNGVTLVDVTYSKDGGVAQTLLSDTVDDGLWSTTLPAASDHSDDGAYEVSIVATDGVDRTSTVLRNVVIDTSAPELSITAPVTDELVDISSYTIRGQVTDNGGHGVVELAFSTTGAFSGEETAIPLTGLNWSVAGVDFSGSEGERTLYVQAHDGINTPTQESVTFNFDTAAPVLTEGGIGSEEMEISALAVVLTGTATDTNALDNLSVAVNGGAAVDVPVTAGSWSYTVEAAGDHSDDGIYTLLFTATDVADRSSTLTRNVTIDTTPPSSPVITSSPGDYVTSGFAVNGTTSDATSGVDYSEYSIDGGTTWFPLNGTTGWYGTIDTTSLAEGDQEFIVRTTDKAGNISVGSTQNFVVDRNNPVITVNGYEGTVYRSAAFSIDGTTSDTLFLSDGNTITVTAAHTGSVVDLSGYPLTETGTGLSHNWSQWIPIDDGDGEYSVEITASDAVGRTSTTTRTVIADTTPPTFTVTNVASDGSTQVDSSSYTVTGTAFDASSGVALVEYSLDYTDDGNDANDLWVPATGTTSWSVPLSDLADTLTQTFAVRATDNAGTTSAVDARTFIVDLASPNIAVTGGNTGISLTYLNENIVLNGTASDTNGLSGTAGVTVTYSLDGGPDTPLLTDTVDDGVWSTTLSVGALGDGEYLFTITATDVVGKTMEFTRTVRLDRVIPTAEYTSLTPVIGTNTVNGKITLRAAVADDIALETTEWALLPFDTPPTGGDYTTVTGSKTAPLFEIDTTTTTGNVVVNGAAAVDRTLADGQTTTLYIRAVDRAGNETTITQDMEVDQASDLPRISFSTIDDSADTEGESYLNLIESNALVRFTVTDDDLVDVSTMDISVGVLAPPPADPSWETVNFNGGAAPGDAKSVTTSHNLYLPAMLPEGTTVFYLRVSDDASAKDGLPAEETQIGPIYVMVDRNFPTLSETDLGGDFYRSALFDLAGEVGDTNALANLAVTESVDGAAATTELDTVLSGTTDTWTLTGMPSGGVADGEYLYTITVTDGSGKNTVLTRTVTIDTTDPDAPVVVTPAAGGWLNSSTYTFQGTASDGTGSGVETVYWVETLRGSGAPVKGDPSWQEATVPGDGTWSATVSIGAAGEREFHAYAVDGAGNDGPITTHNFGLDQAAPVVAVAGGGATQFENGDFTIDGTFTDTSGLTAVTVESSSDGVTFGVATPATAGFTYDDATDSGTFTWNRTLGSETDGTWYYRFSFTDPAGNSSQVTKTVNLDRVAPDIQFTATAPSIDFDGGAATATANGADMELDGSVTEDQGLANLASLEYRIDGGGYTSLPVNGTFAVTGIDTTAYDPTGTITVDVRTTDQNGNEAVETFTFNVDQDTDKPVLTISSPVDGATLTSSNVTVSGTVIDDDGISDAIGQVQYRFCDGHTSLCSGVWQNVTVTGAATSRSFSFTVSAATDGEKHLEMRAYDVNGIESAVIAGTTSLDLVFDTGKPEISGLAPSPGSFHNADFTLSGTAEDVNGDVELLRYRVERDGVQVSPATGWTDMSVSLPANPVSFSETIDTSAGDGTYEIFLEAGDGTNVRETSFSVFVDKTLPLLTFDSPEPFAISGTSENNIITIYGSGSDNYEIDTLSISVVDPTDGITERALPTGTLSGTESWTLSGFDTRNATLLTTSYALQDPDSTGDTDVYEVTLRGSILDEAGNTYTTSGGTDFVFRVDQRGDRPVVTINDIAGDGSSTIQTTTITGNVTDDDGVDAIVVETWDVGSSGPAPDSTETVTLTSGSWHGPDLDWRVTLVDGTNGLRGIRVRASDTADNNGQDYGAADWSRTDTGRIDFQLDTEAPDLTIDGPVSNVTWSANDTFSVDGTGADETNITSLEYKVDDNDFGSGTTPIPDTDANDWETWGFDIAQGDLTDGPHTIYVQATDSVGNTTLRSRQVIVDKTAPAISITAPAAGTAVFGPLTINGTTADLGSGAAGVESVFVGLGKQIDPTSEATLEASTWNAVAGTTSWSFSFTNINDYANSSFSYNTGDTDMDGVEDGGETWTNLWDFTFYVRAVDSAGASGDGNIAYLTTYTVQIDPLQDRPEVTILSPDDGATVGGFVRVFGSAFDSQFVEKVQLAIDADDGGTDYTDDIWSEGVLDETDGDGTRWYLADGTTSWNVRLNEAGEFDPVDPETTHAITFKVRAKDYKVAPGDGIYGAEVEYTISFNKDFPQFTDLSLTSGATVGGSVPFTGIVRDETDIQRIIFSNEGPLLDNTVIFDNDGSRTLPVASSVDVSTAAATAAGITVTLLGTSDPDYDVDFPGSYRFAVPIDTEASGLYPGGAGSMSVKITAEDTTTPSPFTNQNLLSLYVDNLDPSSLTYTGDTEILGTAAELMGTVRDLGTVSGIDRLVVYMTNGAGDIVRLQGGTGSIAGFSEPDVLDEENATYSDYRMVIDNRLEDGNDGGSAGDNDGIPEYLTLSAGTYQWSGLFDSTLVPDGAVTVYFYAEDYAGNSTSDTIAAFIANNRPVIDSVVLGTDLNGDGDVLDGGETSDPVTTGFAATGYTGRNNLLYLEMNVSNGNGTLRYSVRYDGGAELNATLTNNTLSIDTSGIPESVVANDRVFDILIYDSTTSDDTDSTDELTDSISIGVTIDNVDDVAPSLAIAPFGQRYNESEDDGVKTLQAVANYEDTIAMSGVDRLGHVEYAADSLFDNGAANGDGTDDDADLSGRVIFRGKTEDNQRISRITAAIVGFDPDGGGAAAAGDAFNIYNEGSGGSLSDADWAFTVDGSAYLTEDYGNVFNWTLEFNTAAIDSVAAADVTVTLTVYDANGTPNSGSDQVTVDIVPYISAIDGYLSGSLGKTLSRSAEGLYPLASGESVTVHGFNLDPGTGGVRLSIDPDGLDGVTRQGTALTATVVDTTAVDVTVSAAGSGYLTVITNDIPSINSINDNTLEYNRIDSANHLVLTDDVNIALWEFTDLAAAVTLADNAEYPSMALDGDTPAFMYVNNAAGYGQARYLHGTTDKQIFTNWDLFTYTAIDFNSDGNHAVLVDINVVNGNLGDYNSGNYGGIVTSFYYDVAAHTWSNYDFVDNTIWLDNLVDTVEPQTTAVLDRYQYPDFDVVGTTAQTRAFYSVYDRLENEIIFRTFRVGTDTTIDDASGGRVNNQGSALYTDLPQYEADGTIPEYDGDNRFQNSNVTGKSPDPADGAIVTRFTPTDSFGDHTAVATNVDGTVAALVYYDTAGTGSLVYRYATSADSFATWSSPLTLATNAGFEYTDMEIEDSGTVHIAYYDSYAGDVRYVRLSAYDSTSVTNVLVDSYLIVGDKLSMTTHNGVPFITYKGIGNTVRAAWLTAGSAVAGVDASDRYNGNWEVQSLPTPTADTDSNRFNIGVRQSDDKPVVGYTNYGLAYQRLLPDLTD